LRKKISCKGAGRIAAIPCEALFVSISQRPGREAISDN
jgi:hypothetical protein